MKEYTEIIMILDQSGSMHGLEGDTIGGYNQFLSSQKKTKGKATITTVLFNHEMQVIHHQEDIKKVKPLTEEDYQTYGSTALLDALGTTIQETTTQQELWERIPEHTIVVIMTDGMENASKKFTYPEIKKLIQEKEKAGWEFVFLGANIDSVEVANNIGIKKSRAHDFIQDEKGTALNFMALDKAVCGVREFGCLPENAFEMVDEDFEKRSKN